jgi:nucleotide-binding universal stress UspA family protein
MKLSKILVATSGDSTDEEVVALACDLAKKSKAEVYVVYVIEVNRTLPLDAVVEADIAKAEKILTRAEDTAAENDYEIETDLIQAREAGSAIVDEARERKVDLILMGLNYKKRFGVFNLGTAIPHVLEESPCRVIFLRESMEQK